MTFRFACVAGTAICLAAGLIYGPSALAAGRGASVSAPATETYPVASGVRVGGDDRQVRFVMDLSRKVDIATFMLADPYRVVVDLPQVTFKLPEDAGRHGRGLIKNFRYGLVMKGGSRIVIDTTGPVKVKKAFTLAAAAGQPARLVLDIRATDRTSFLHAVAVETRSDRARASKRVAAPPAVINDDPRPLIVLDPGHGGIDDGTRAKSGELEKNVVLAFAKVLRHDLEKTRKYRVVMTRSDDTYVALGERVRFARAHHAALFISLHADFLPRREGHTDGASIYTLSEHASDAAAARLAESENKADVIAGVNLAAEPDDVASILVDLAQRETKTFSVQFARTAMGELKVVTPLHKRPVKSAGFKVLTAPDVPSVLIELGYMSDKGDLRHLVSPAWRRRTAAALTQAVETFFAPRLAGATNRTR